MMIDRLTRAWAILAGLTILSVATAADRAGPLVAAVAAAAAFVKARQILDHFLDLRRAGTGWRAFFTILVATILLACLALQAVGARSA
ncbi:MAG: cytochrome C oxidase subunit IV family protein [Actinomycetota bacterium]